MIILDGGLGRQLKAMGAPFRQPEWSALALMEGPEFVRAAHDAFIESGATIITHPFMVLPFRSNSRAWESPATSMLALSLPIRMTR